MQILNLSGARFFFTSHVILLFDLHKLQLANAHMLSSNVAKTTGLHNEFVGLISSLTILKSAPAKAFFEILKMSGSVIEGTQFAKLEICFSIFQFVLRNLEINFVWVFCV
jgi:hypothetical protein